MQTLPKYFVIKWTDSPLWREYIDWLMKKEDKKYFGIYRRCYYGFDEKGVGHSTSILHFSKSVVEITLEEWKQAVGTPEPVKSNDMRRYLKVDLFPNAPKLAEDLALIACMSNSGLNLSLDALKNNADEHLGGSSSTLQGNVFTLFQSDKVVLIIEEREEFVMPETKDY